MNQKAEPENQFSIQKIYVKDISFESPSAPDVFNFQNWDPKIELNLNGNNKQVGEGVYEVVLSVTATVSNQDQTAFLIEVQQAGVFAMAGFTPEDARYILGSQCMTILFPYAREIISDMTSRGGFPPLLLNPVNFDALFAKAMQEQQKSQETASAADEVKH
jgi:preprotein translocase subunit SecB